MIGSKVLIRIVHLTSDTSLVIREVPLQLIITQAESIKEELQNSEISQLRGAAVFLEHTW